MYFGLFQAHITYGLLIWGHTSHSTKILLIQKRVIHSMCKAGPREHCRPLFTRLRLLTIVNLYIYSCVLYIKNIGIEGVVREEIHSYNTRRKADYDIPRHRLTKTSNSHKVNTLKIFNKLPQSARVMPTKILKPKLYSWLSDNPFYSLQEYYDLSSTDINL